MQENELFCFFVGGKKNEMEIYIDCQRRSGDAETFLLPDGFFSLPDCKDNRMLPECCPVSTRIICECSTKGNG